MDPEKDSYVTTKMHLNARWVANGLGSSMALGPKWPKSKMAQVQNALGPKWARFKMEPGPKLGQVPNWAGSNVGWSNLRPRPNFIAIWAQVWPLENMVSLGDDSQTQVFGVLQGANGHPMVQP